MLRRHLRAASLLAAGALTAATSTLAGSAAGAPSGSPVSLWAPEKVVAWSYGGDVYTNLGLRLVAEDAPFELWSTRASYDDPIVTEWRTAPGGPQLLPEGTMTDFSGLPGFLDISVTRVSTGNEVAAWSRTGCLNGDAQRVRPDAPATSPYPWGCPWNPYTLGSVMGIEAGYSASIGGEFFEPLQIAPGKYDVTASIAPTYSTLFGIADADAARTFRLVVKRADGGFGRPVVTPRPSTVAQPAAHEPRHASAGVFNGPKPDLQSLPAWGIQLNRKGTVLRFAATVWNAGPSPLVVDGFRREGEDVMDAYEYFFDADGNQVGYQQVGEMHWHAGNHNHWHFEDFARYRLLNADQSEAVVSTKQSFCLANTDAVDYTRPDADWHPENTDLHTACGGIDAISVREVLSAGSGDTYLQYRYGQAFPIKDVPDGVYFVAVEANPLGNLVETDTANNASVRKIRLKTSASGERRVKVFQVGIVEEHLPGWFRPSTLR